MCAPPSWRPASNTSRAARAGPRKAEIQIDAAEIFAVDELDPRTGETANSLDFESLSASVDAPIDFPELKGRGFACDALGYHAVLAVKAVARASPALASALAARP